MDFYEERARKNRRSAKRVRVAAAIFGVLAGIFFVLGVVGVASGKPISLVTIGSSLVIAWSTYSLIETARSYEVTAKRWDRLA